jgi:nitrile hydratase accessory protein
VNGAAAALPLQPRDQDGAVFREPWEAQAFAMTVELHQRGLFTWDEWARLLGRHIAAAASAGDADLGDTYYVHWLSALEEMVAEKGVAPLQDLIRYQRAWGNAAERTPHGKPIELEQTDFETQSTADNGPPGL